MRLLLLALVFTVLGIGCATDVSDPSTSAQPYISCQPANSASEGATEMIHCSGKGSQITKDFYLHEDTLVLVTLVKGPESSTSFKVLCVDCPQMTAADSKLLDEHGIVRVQHKNYETETKKMIWIGAPGQYKIHVITASKSEPAEWEFFAIQTTAPRVSLSATPEAATPIATNIGRANVFGYVANTDGDGVKPRKACQADAARAFPDKVPEGSELWILKDIKSGECTDWLEVTLGTDQSKRFFIHSTYVTLEKP